MPVDLITKPIPVTDISGYYGAGVQVDVLRLDLIDPIISGNKWFKLRIYLEDAERSGKKHIVTFGGAWSNHIIATAAICERNGMRSTGIIRGEEPKELSTTLIRARAAGMRLVYVSRDKYKEKIIPEDILDRDTYVVPEGGAGENGVLGAASILDHCSNDYSHYVCAVGTGTMMAGLIRRKRPGQMVTGISTMKNNFSLDSAVEELSGVRSQDDWELLHHHHLGGYGKHTTALLEFMNQFYLDTQIPTDIIYTGKLFLATRELINAGHFPVKSRLLIIHSGGLQGNASLRKGTLIF